MTKWDKCDTSKPRSYTMHIHSVLSMDTYIITYINHAMPILNVYKCMCIKFYYNSNFSPVFLLMQSSAVAVQYTDCYEGLAEKGFQNIPRADIELQTRVGGSQDQFGEVYKGMIKTLYGKVVVLLKVMQSKASDRERAAALKEAEYVGQFNHPHIVKHFGIVTEGGPVSS